ncbi:hypothetical protein Q5530_37200 [Saccharothrix sp. BKS2]|uniref:hypothetical protein n=1 Tax=Saccharothrix sp. BKS2 TaxID=3064400 RepID=UPI0039EB7A6D
MPEGNAPEPPPRRSWWARERRKVALGGVTGLLCLAGVLFTLYRDDPEDALPPVDPACDRYEVTAKTLFRRDAEGQVIDQFVRDERLEVLRRNGSAGNRYWYVSGSGGKRGWVDPDPRWMRPLC